MAEIRSFHCELRAQADFSLSGYAATFNTPSKPIPSGNRGSFIELIRSGAFTKVLADPKTDCRCLFNHDDSKILGRQSAGTLTLKQDDKGLAFRCQLDKNNSEHRNLYSSVQRGDLSDMSFGFTTDDDDWTNDGKQNVRTIRSFNGLFDVSVVCSPAYDNTSVAARNFVHTLFPYGKKSYQQLEFERSGVDRQLETLRGLRYAAEVRAEESHQSLLKSTQALDAALRNKAEEQRASFGFEVASDGGGAADPEMKFRCKSASTSSSAAEHRLAAKIHRCRRDKAKTADDYAWDDSAAQDHDAAADGDVESQRRVVKRCNRDYKSAMFNATMNS